MSRWCVVAVSGATCCGKTTLARRLHAALPGSVLLSQDDYFLPEGDSRHRRAHGLDHTNWDVLSAIDSARMAADVAAILARPPPPAPPAVLILEGFLVLNDPLLRPLCDARVFITLQRDVCWQRRQRRSYEPPDVPGYFDACVWPMYEKHEAELRALADSGVTFLDGAASLDELYERVSDEVERAQSRAGNATAATAAAVEAGSGDE